MLARRESKTSQDIMGDLGGPKENPLELRAFLHLRLFPPELPAVSPEGTWNSERGTGLGAEC